MLQAYGGGVAVAVVAGRIVATGPWQFGNRSSTSVDDTFREEISFSGNGHTGSIHYKRTDPAGELSLEINSEGALRFLRRQKENAAAASVEFVQVPDDPLMLSVGPEGHQQVYRAATLWHLAIAQPEVCRQHVYPVLEVLRPQWQLARTAAQVEQQLLAFPADLARRQRQQWAGLVEQLADNRFAQREAADRQLRSGGMAAQAYLEQLDFSRLDAEQQFRIRRIVKSFGRQGSDDTPEQAARLLADDPAVWLGLLARDDVSIRRAAAKRLALLLGEPVPVDPAADPASQKDARDALRARIEKKSGGRKAEDGAKPQAANPATQSRGFPNPQSLIPNP
jgi:hypothetical protein